VLHSKKIPKKYRILQYLISKKYKNTQKIQIISNIQEIQESPIPQEIQNSSSITRNTTIFNFSVIQKFPMSRKYKDPQFPCYTEFLNSQ
jgi:hypothetical protein